MKNTDRSEYLTRANLLKLLSDEEVAAVSKAETATRLDEGEEYVDLEQLDQGIQRTDGIPVSMGRVLPRRSVDDKTWKKIVGALGSPKPVAVRPRP